MQYFFVIDGQQLPIIIRKHHSSRRIVIRYQSLRHAVSLTLPRRASIRQGLRFIERQRDWIKSRIQEERQTIAFYSGATIPVLGESCIISHIGGRGLVRRAGNIIEVPGDARFLNRRVRDWLKSELKGEIIRRVEAYAHALGKKSGKISLRDTSSQWGSCNRLGNLSFSWRLVFAPVSVLNYLICHEVAHLDHLRHDQAFWQKVAQLCPHWQHERQWLKNHGRTLYHYGN